MAADGGIELHASDAGGEVQARVQRIHTEDIAVGTARRRARSAVSDGAEVIDALGGAKGQAHLR